MIIDIHGHYTTEPQALQLFRDKQLAGLADPARKPASAELGISDDMLVKSVEPQLKFQKERGSDLTIFSPRASGCKSPQRRRLRSIPYQSKDAAIIKISVLTAFVRCPFAYTSSECTSVIAPFQRATS